MTATAHRISRQELDRGVETKISGLHRTEHFDHDRDLYRTCLREDYIGVISNRFTGLEIYCNDAKHAGHGIIHSFDAGDEFRCKGRFGYRFTPNARRELQH